MNHDDAEAALFGDVLTCEEHQRAGFSPQPEAAITAETLCARAEASLQAVAVIEDNGGEDEDSSKFPALRRIEARLDLLLQLFATQLQRDASDPLLALRWSARGACLPVSTALPEGCTGLFRAQAAPWLPEPLTLPARVLACQPAESGTPYLLWLRFEPLTPALQSALERHLFRQHRKAIASRRADRLAS